MIQFAYEKWLSCSDEAPGSVISVSSVEISGQSSNSGRQKTQWLKQEATHSHWSCPAQPSVALVPHRPTPPLFLLPLLVLSSSKVLVPPMPTFAFTQPFCYCCAQRSPPFAPASSKQSSASHALILSCSLSACILSSQPLLFPCAPCCGLLLCLHPRKPLLGSLSSWGTSVSRVVIPAGELWRGRGVCS